MIVPLFFIVPVSRVTNYFRAWRRKRHNRPEWPSYNRHVHVEDGEYIKHGRFEDDEHVEHVEHKNVISSRHKHRTVLPKVKKQTATGALVRRRMPKK